jgi:alkanesulfonate monooxygenase SsuD/methylene tetrahydromethanopterin reductase-like flavin-dependent oxidoreductase (luciferase family)
MVAIIGGEPRRFRPLVDLYRETSKRFGYSPDRLRVGVHALGYVAPTRQQAIDDFFPGYARAVASDAKERGWPAASPVLTLMRNEPGRARCSSATPKK